MRWTLAVLGSLCVVTGAWAQGEKFAYICSGYPIQAGKELVVTARGEDGSTEKASVTKPGGQYYLVNVRLRMGVAYDVEYELGGTLVHTDALDAVERVTPARPRIKEIQFDKVPKMKSGPSGMVPLSVQAKGVSASDLGQPTLSVTSDAGKSQNSTRKLSNGLGFVYVKPGFTYTVLYELGGKHYSRTGLVPDDGTVPARWDLAFVEPPPPPPCEVGASCDDGDPKTKKDKLLPDCTCKGIPDDCTRGTPCDDGDPGTIGEKFNSRCECVGGVQKPDCLGVPGGSSNPGESCDDGNPQTVNDVFSPECKCVGTTLEKDCEGNVGGTAVKGSSCDDGDARTTNDKWGSDCVCRGMVVSKTSLPIIEHSASSELRCSDLHVLVSGKPREAWKVGDVDEVNMEVDRTAYAGPSSQGESLVAHGDSLRGLIYVNDSLWLELSSPDGSFTIEAGKGNRHRSIRETAPLRFKWTITAAKAPSEEKDDWTVLKLTSYTLNCNTGNARLEEFNTVEYKVKVTEKVDILKWIQEHIAAIGTILAGIAVIVGYFRDWFGGLFKRKEKGGTPA
ncbi:MAG: hypothetical protein ABI432_01080 [Flavobacteriales bacterium]